MGHDRKAIVEQVSTPWMLTFADLLALMLTFFVLLFSMNRLQFDDWKSVVDTMSSEFNPERLPLAMEEGASSIATEQRRRQALNLTYLKALLEDTISTSEILDGLELYQQGQRLAISIPSDMLFEAGQDVLKEAATDRLDLLANTLFAVKNQLVIAGYTRQNAVVKTRQYPDSWQLALARSRIVAMVLQDNGYPEPITSKSYGDSRNSDVANNLPISVRDRWTDRIDIIIVDERRDITAFDL